MLSGVLRSPRAVHVNSAIMRAFVKLRESLSLHKDLARRLNEFETKLVGHDADLKDVFDALRQLMEPPAIQPKRIGFKQRG